MWFRRNGYHEEPALVLSGGGAMGALQAGMLRVLVRRGFRPSRIVGTSVGALNGAFLAFYPHEEGVDTLTDIWRGLEHERYISFNPVRMAYRFASRQLCLFNNDFLRRLIAEHTTVDDFAAAELPLHISVTNLHTGQKHVLSEGAVSQAVLASTAIPGVFPPVEIDGHTYIDGGVTSNLDLTTAVDLGARKILAIDLSHCFELPVPSNVVDVITTTVDIVMRERVRRDLLHLADKAEITLLQPRIERGPRVGDLSQVAKLLDEGEAFAERIADDCFDAKGRLRPGTFTQQLSLGEVEPVTA